MRDSTVTNRLRSVKQFSLIFANTNNFKNSFIPYGLAQYQYPV